MIQNIIIIVIVIACAWFIGRRFYTNLSKSQHGDGCGCSCSGCGPDIVSNCQKADSDSDHK